MSVNVYIILVIALSYVFLVIFQLDTAKSFADLYSKHKVQGLRFLKNHKFWKKKIQRKSHKFFYTHNFVQYPV